MTVDLMTGQVTRPNVTVIRLGDGELVNVGAEASSVAPALHEQINRNRPLSEQEAVSEVNQLTIKIRIVVAFQINHAVEGRTVEVTDQSVNLYVGRAIGPANANRRTASVTTDANGEFRSLENLNLSANELGNVFGINEA